MWSDLIYWIKHTHNDDCNQQNGEHPQKQANFKISPRILLKSNTAKEKEMFIKKRFFKKIQITE